MGVVVVALAGFAATGSAVALAFYLARKRDLASERAIAALNRQAKLQRQFDESQETLADTEEALAAVTRDRARDIMARRKVEQHRDRLLTALASAGDPGGIAAGIRAELRALSEVSNVPAPAPTEGGTDASAVHDTVPTPGGTES